MGSNNSVCVGIDDVAIHFPRLYMDMKDFADLRGEDYGKLNKGLGLKAMSIPDVHEDTATMGANAVMKLIDRNGLNPRNIGRMYLGTESALDVLSQLQHILWICLPKDTLKDMVLIASAIVTSLI